VETWLDGSTLIVRIPYAVFQRRGGRKRIVAPDGSAIVSSSKPYPDGALVKAFARAWRWHELARWGRLQISHLAGGRGSGSARVAFGARGLDHHHFPNVF
jgi:hypothetical protein